jgi:hypothetical protein
MSSSVGYFEAWATWFNGQEVDPHANMLGVPMLWWGRAGNIATFVGGATVLLDIIGPERLRAWGQRPDRLLKPSKSVMTACYLIFWVGWIAAAFSPLAGVDTSLASTIVTALGILTVGVAVPLSLLNMHESVLVKLVIRSLDTERPAQVFRIAGVVLLFIGFHFDLLSS